MLSFDDFVSLVNDGEDIAKSPDFFHSSLNNQSEIPVNELCVLRRWNSHTPSVYDVLGGGYFLMWNNKGTVIDPGCGFIKLFRNKTNYTFGQINSVIATHDHVDHCQDLGLLIILLRQYNKWLVEQGEAPKIWEMLISYGVADEYLSMFNHPDNAPFLFWQRILSEKELKVEHVKDVPKSLKEAGSKKLLANEKYLESYLERAGKSFEELYSYEITALRANHKELLGASTTFGVKIVLKEYQKDDCTIVISGDTAISNDIKNKKANGDNLVALYSGADLLVLHVGSVEKPSEKYNENHLCLNGVVEILSRINPKPKLVILTEWGYEFGRLGVNGRSYFTYFIAEKLKAKGCPEYYAAVQIPDEEKPSMPSKENKIPIIPADISLRIKLPDFGIYTESKGKNIWSDYKNIYAKEVLERIDYIAR